VKAALRFAEPGHLEIGEVLIDRVLDDEVLVRTVGSGLCHSDLHFIDHLVPGVGAGMPALFGHEAAGVVEAVGADVTYVRPGDHVVTFPLQFCGECEYCLRGMPTQCTASPGPRRAGAGPRLTFHGEPVFQFTNIGGFAEQLLVHEHAVVKIDPDYPFDRAAIVGCGVATGLGAALNTAEVRPGSSVAVIGLGGVGLAALQGSSLAGAARIVAIDTHPSKFQLARQLGATDTIDASSADVVEAVRELTGGGVDYSFEAIGAKPAMEQAVEMLRAGGVATLVGIGPGIKIEVNPSLFLAERRLQGSYMGSCRFRTDIPRFVQLDMSGRIDLAAMVERRIELEEVNEGYQAMRDGAINGRRVIMFPV